MVVLLRVSCFALVWGGGCLVYVTLVVLFVAGVFVWLVFVCWCVWCWCFVVCFALLHKMVLCLLLSLFC